MSFNNFNQAKILTPFYDPLRSYEENYVQGPFGAFADQQIWTQTGEPEYDFFGHKVYLPFGIPAGPVLNSKYCQAAFAKGFDLVVYKTVRSDSFPCHPYPNVLPVEATGDITLDKANQGLQTKSVYEAPLSITNSFGVPSKPYAVWQADVRQALNYVGKGQVLILSFMGTVRPNQTQEELVADFVLAAQRSVETGVKVLEVNLSCPNIGNEGLICYLPKAREQILRAIRQAIGNSPLIVKIGYYHDLDDLEDMARVVAEYADGVSAINTIQAAIYDSQGNQALPGPNRLRSGVCGAGIKWAGLEMVQKLHRIRQQKGYSYKIIGVGGVMTPQDYFDYRQAGADVVMSATGAMWNPYLAQEIKQIYTQQN